MLIVRLCICVHVLSTIVNANLCVPRHSADTLFHYWNLRTGASMHALQLHRQTHYYTGLEHESFQDGHVCVLKVAYDGFGHFTATPPGKQGQAFCVMSQAYEIRSVDYVSMIVMMESPCMLTEILATHCLN